MRTKSTAIVLFLLLSSLAYAATASAKTWEPGVAKGDFFTYEMYAVYESNLPNATIQVSPFEQNTTDWVRIDIAGISDSIVYQVYTLHFKDGNETRIAKQTDINPSNSADFNFSEKGIPICAASLNVGDELPTVNLQINGRLTLTFPSGEKRETDSVSWNFTDDWGYCYFDRETGMLVELHRVHLFANPRSGEVVRKADIINLSRTNKWAIQKPKSTVLLPDSAAANGLILPLFTISLHRHFVLRKRSTAARRKSNLANLHTKEKKK